MPNPSQHDPSQSPGGSESPADSFHRSKYAGKRLGKFQIVGELGRGGMGAVFEARDTVLDRHVAIKLLPRSLAAQPESLQRFLREARAAAKLHHPHVVAVYEADQCNGQYYIVLELVRGGSMQDVLRTGPLGWREATRVLADACRGLEVAHRAGLVHRDIKPANLMRSADGTVKLADFGLVRSAESATMTASGNVLGTPQFMSPEQCRSELANERSDLYAMGATYYALLTGRVPYPGEAPLLVMSAHLWNPIPDPRDIDPTIPPACTAIIQRAMAKDPDDRYLDARQLLADLESALGEANEPTVAELPSRGMATPTIKNTLTQILQTNVDRTPRTTLGPRRPTRRILEASVLGVGVVGLLFAIWWLIGGTSTTPVSPPLAEGSRTTNPKSSEPPATLTFALPEMRRDEPRRDANRESWSRNYPGITHVGVSNSGEFLVVLVNGSARAQSAPEPGHVHVWSRDGQKLLDERLVGRATSVAISFDSSRLAVGGTRGQGVLLWSTKTWTREPVALSPEDGNVDAVAFSRDGRWLAFTTSVAETESAWVLWDLAAQKPFSRTAIPKSGPSRTIAFAPDEELHVMVGSGDGNVRMWSALSTGKEPRLFRTGVAVGTLALSPARSVMAVGAGKYFALWSYLQDKRDYAAPSSTGNVACLAFSPSGKHVCWASGPVVQCLEVDARRSVATLGGFRGDVRSLAYLPDATHMITASADDQLIFWSLKGVAK